ncbi:zinc finger MYM-type protein 1 [Artemisia annua]|uniref:Zinc finger MYM-type protein 1 n=1 Tax=Artemisia annua TaxID=35608 RepID=A0A2U1PE20_ARTAN|nr:zinc finger MYM-type protein 1 [Artemisia annua]
MSIKGLIEFVSSDKLIIVIKVSLGFQAPQGLLKDSNKLQPNDMLIDVAIKNLDGLISYFKNYRENGFENVIFQAEQSAETVGVELEFLIKCAPCRKKHFVEIPY